VTPVRDGRNGGTTDPVVAYRAEPPPSVEAAAQGSVRYLSVGVCGRRFAIPLDQVIGVSESATVTPIPFSPAPFEGLVKAMGQVVPQISLASLLGLPSASGGTLVVASDLGGSVALRVEHVYAMLQIDRDKLVLADPETRAKEPIVLGHFGEGPLRCSVISMDQLTSGELAETMGEAGAVLLAPDDAANVRDEHAAVRQAEPYLMISLSGHIYAVKIDQVAELVELSSLRPVPRGPPWIAGMIDLRGEPILGLSLPQLLGQPEQGPGRLGLVVMFPLVFPPARVALIAERSLGIERYASNQIHAMREPVAGIESYLVRADDSITGVINPQALLRPIDAELQDWVPRAEPAQSGTVQTASTGYRQFLTLRVGREMIAVSLDRIHRLQASVLLTPLPALCTGFDGMADVGDAVVPVIDLRRVLSGGIEAPASQHAPPCLLAMIDGSVAGLIVDQVLRIETIPESHVMPAENAPYLPVSEVLHLHGQMMSVVSLDRLLPQQ
jgi:chemotaxis signal transduction protein